MQNPEARQWMPIANAIELVAARRNIAGIKAWEKIKADIDRGELSSRGVDDKSVRRDFEPHWIAFTAKFLSLDREPRPLFNDPGDQLPVYESRQESHQLIDFPHVEVLWFDRRKAAEARLARAVSADNCAAFSLPPKFLRDLVVDAARLNELT